MKFKVYLQNYKDFLGLLLVKIIAKYILRDIQVMKNELK